MIRLIARVLGLADGARSARGESVRRFAPRLEVLDGRAMPSASLMASVDIGAEHAEAAHEMMGWQPPPGCITISAGAAGGVSGERRSGEGIAVSGGENGVDHKGGAAGGVVGSGGALGGVTMGGLAGGVINQ